VRCERNDHGRLQNDKINVKQFKDWAMMQQLTQQKKLEGIVAPIVAKLYGQGHSHSQGHGQQQSQEGPSVEEVD
jgi:hypothetical protein